MFIVVRNLSNGDSFVAERRIVSPAARARAMILRELDRILRPNWRRGFTCNVFFCTGTNGNFHPLDTMFQLTKAEIRLRRGFIKVYIDEKSPQTLAADERRLAVAMAFHPRLIGENYYYYCPLACVDAMVVVQLILVFAGL